jgi:hypothetical protein
LGNLRVIDIFHVVDSAIKEIRKLQPLDVAAKLEINFNEENITSDKESEGRAKSRKEKENRIKKCCIKPLELMSYLQEIKPHHFTCDKVGTIKNS